MCMQGLSRNLVCITCLGDNDIEKMRCKRVYVHARILSQSCDKDIEKMKCERVYLQSWHIHITCLSDKDIEKMKCEGICACKDFTQLITHPACHMHGMSIWIVMSICPTVAELRIADIIYRIIDVLPPVFHALQLQLQLHSLSLLFTLFHCCYKNYVNSCLFLLCYWHCRNWPHHTWCWMWQCVCQWHWSWSSRQNMGKMTSQNLCQARKDQTSQVGAVRYIGNTRKLSAKVLESHQVLWRSLLMYIDVARVYQN